ncbi:MAG: DUF1003 domain-containing protein [Gemmatimonadaceae bacterium]
MTNSLSGSVEGNSERRRRSLETGYAIRSIKARHAEERTRMMVFAEQLARLAGSTRFLLIHAVWFVTWILWNTGLLGLREFDPFPFGLLTMIVSLEAIFLSIFVLNSQGREAGIAELREELALQINLRTEEEVTKTLQLVAGLYGRLGHQLAEDPDLSEMIQPLDPGAIERTLAQQLGDAEKFHWLRKLIAERSARRSKSES